MINYTITSSPIGKLLLAKTKFGLSHIIFEHKIQKFESIVRNNFPNEKISNDHHALVTEVDQLTEYFSGKRKVFNIQLSLNLPPFFKKVIKNKNNQNWASYPISYIEKRVSNA